MTIRPILALFSLLAVTAPAQAQNVAAQFDYYVLALSWQPTFCHSNPAKPECLSQTPQRYDASHLVLHGLWPNKIGDAQHSYGYCAVASSVKSLDNPDTWCSLPELALDDHTRIDLSKYMPGYASCLERHEWYKHGSCAGISAQDFFSATDALVTKVAATNFGAYLAANVGNVVSLNDLLAQIKTDFNDKSGDVVLRCAKIEGIDVLSEVWMYLKAPLPSGFDLAQSLTQSDAPLPGNCPAQLEIYKK